MSVTATLTGTKRGQDLSSAKQFVEAPTINSRTPSRPASPSKTMDNIREKKPIRTFAPEPVETTFRSTRERPEKPDTKISKTNRNPRPADSLAQRRRFAPQLIETSARNNKRRDIASGSSSEAHSSRSSISTDLGSHESSTNKCRRKFAPQLIETSKRSRKAGDTCPTVQASDKTEAVPAPRIAIPKHLHTEFAPEPPTNSPAIGPISDRYGDDVSEARRLGKSLPSRSISRHSCRSHSFRIPDLDTIESSESEESSPPSLSSSPTSSDRSYLYKHATRVRESVDDRFSGYLLDIAARAAEKQLRQQAMAAFPNDDHHEPVHHYVDETSEEYASREQERESSFTQVNWELREMREFQARLSRNKDQEKTVAEKLEQKVKEASRNNPWGDPAAALGNAWKRGEEPIRPEQHVRPPMLGSDISFPRCSSPQSERFDVTQGCHKLKESMCYLTAQSQHMEDNGKQSLWAVRTSSRSPKRSSNTSQSPKSNKSGLWGGCCVAPNTPPRGPSGLMTPSIEIPVAVHTPVSTPFRSNFPSPSGPQDYFSGIHEKLELEETMEKEYSDAFVTQVYNYLSLGYPSIARDFDYELGKISMIDVSELRHDDELAQSRGYVRLGENENCSEISEESCARWRALRIYIREWAKQQPGMVSGAHALGGFGVGARRGSWAI